MSVLEIVLLSYIVVSQVSAILLISSNDFKFRTIFIILSCPFGLITSIIMSNLKKKVGK